jgi:SAM-dependent methyltransferase
MHEPHENVSGRWDEEYRKGRYIGDEPVGFVDAIAAAVHAYRPSNEVGLYIGCGNGRNYIPLVDRGLDLIGIDISSVAIRQLAQRLPERAGRLIHGDIAALPCGSKFGTVIGIQVFQHGPESDAYAHIRGALRLLLPGGLFCVRVNAAGTQVEYEHKVVETSDAGGFTIQYQEGPKKGLLVHFFARGELERLMRDLEPVVPLGLDRTYRQAPRRGHWDQWEAIWRSGAAGA